MNILTFANTSPLHDAYIKDVGEIELVLALAVQLSAADLGVDAARLFSVADKVESAEVARAA